MGRKAFNEFKKLLISGAKFRESDIRLVALSSLESLRFQQRICGVYFQRDARMCGRRCYQRLLHAPASYKKLCCDGVYIFWSNAKSQWIIAPKVSEYAPIIAYCENDSKDLATLSGTWQVQDGDGQFVDGRTLTITTAPEDSVLKDSVNKKGKASTKTKTKPKA